MITRRAIIAQGAGIVLLGFIVGYAARAAVVGLWFAPGEEPEQAIVAEFAKAEKSINYQMYNFTSPEIGTALIDARGRGVKVEIMLDHGAAQSPHCQADRCSKAGCKVWVDNKHPIAHNKVRIIDEDRVMGGSYNDSAQAHHNAENLVMEDGAKTVAKYLDNYREHKSHSVPWDVWVKDQKKKAKAK